MRVPALYINKAAGPVSYIYNDSLIHGISFIACTCRLHYCFKSFFGCLLRQWFCRYGFIHNGISFVFVSGIVSQVYAEPVISCYVFCFVYIVSLYVPFAEGNGREAFFLSGIADAVSYVLAGGGAVFEVVVYNIIVAAFACIYIIAAPVVDDVVAVVHVFFRGIADAIEAWVAVVAMGKQVVVC